jgi:hypothetical protein
MVVEEPAAAEEAVPAEAEAAPADVEGTPVPEAPPAPEGEASNASPVTYYQVVFRR